MLTATKMKKQKTEKTKLTGEIALPEGVTAGISGHYLSVKGPKGESKRNVSFDLQRREKVCQSLVLVYMKIVVSIIYPLVIGWQAGKKLSLIAQDCKND